DEPDVGLPAMQVKRLDRAGLHLAVVDLPHLEARKRRVNTVAEPAQLGERAPVVDEAPEVHDGDPLDGGRRGRGAENERALGGVGEIHQIRPTFGRGLGMAGDSLCVELGFHFAPDYSSLVCDSTGPTDPSTVFRARLWYCDYDRSFRPIADTGAFHE